MPKAPQKYVVTMVTQAKTKIAELNADGYFVVSIAVQGGMGPTMLHIIADREVKYE